MAHVIVPAAEEILDKEYKVHEHGFVRLVDYLGGDKRIVQAARVSYGEGTKSYRQDRGLIDHLMRNEHTSPFEQVVLTYHVKMPIFVARQWIRHRTARLNEISGRYSILKNEFYIPSPEDIGFQSDGNKQGRSLAEVPEDLKQRVLDLLQIGQEKASADYDALLGDNIAKELARINLPLSVYTQMYWQMDLHNLFHFLGLRMDSHAQKEIRDYAFVIFDLAKKVAPMACDSFEDNVLKGVHLSAKDIRDLRHSGYLVDSGEPLAITGTRKGELEMKVNRIRAVKESE